LKPVKQQHPVLKAVLPKTRLFLAVFVAVSLPFAHAQPQSESMDRYRREAEGIQDRIKTEKEKIEKIGRKETDLLSRLNRIELKLQAARKKMTVLKSEIADLEHKIALTRETSLDLKKRIRANETHVADRLVAFYKLSWLGTAQILASSRSISEFYQRKKALERILADDERIRRKMVRNQSELHQLLTRLESQQAALQQRKQSYAEQMRAMADEKLRRSQLLASIRDRKEFQASVIESLKHAADELDRKIRVLQRAKPSGLSDAAVTLIPFSDFKGLLRKPVKGTIISLYGAYKNRRFNVMNFRSGIDIKTDLGEPVRAVYHGEVLYSDWFKGYGNMMIIDHGASYYTVYANIGEAFKAQGERVETDEVIATAGDSGSMAGAKLYFEIRHHGKPLNPIDWLQD
jgi:septal ring factor EnvC (AmiA/AmiB activator)